MQSDQALTPDELIFYSEQQRQQRHSAVGLLIFAIFCLLANNPWATVGGVACLAASVLLLLQLLTHHPRLVLRGHYLHYVNLPGISRRIDLSRHGPARVVQRRYGRWPGRLEVAELFFRPIEDEQALTAAEASSIPTLFDRGRGIALSGLVPNDPLATARIADVVNEHRPPSASPTIDRAQLDMHRRRIMRHRTIRKGFSWFIIVILVGGYVWLRLNQ